MYVQVNAEPAGANSMHSLTSWTERAFTCRRSGVAAEPTDLTATFANGADRGSKFTGRTVFAAEAFQIVSCNWQVKTKRVGENQCVHSPAGQSGVGCSGRCEQ